MKRFLVVQDSPIFNDFSSLAGSLTKAKRMSFKEHCTYVIYEKVGEVKDGNAVLIDHFDPIKMPKVNVSKDNNE